MGNINQHHNKLIEVIATSDIHGALFPKDYYTKRNNLPSMTSLSTYIKQQRCCNDRDILLLDNGDILQGGIEVFYYDYVDRKSENIAASVMNYMQYDAASVGNHDLEGGHSVYDKFRRELNCPLLSANIINTKTGKPYFQPYMITEKSGYKIAILGLTTPKVPTWLPEKLISNMEFDDMVESADYWVNLIKEKENPDLLIGLLHSGTDFSYNNQNQDIYKNENASEFVARIVDGFDLIIAGHDHQGHNFTVTNNANHNVLIIAPTSKLKNFADIIIDIDSDGNKNISGKTYLNTSLNIDYDMYKLFSPNINLIENYYNEPIGTTDEDLISSNGLFGNDTMTNIIHHVQFDYTGADISIVAAIPSYSYINKGILYRKDLFKLYKYDNMLYTMRLNGQEIKDFLEFSYWGWFNKMNSEDDYLLKYKLDNNGNLTSNNFPATETQSYNFDSAKGIIYTVDVSKDKGERVDIISMQDGTPFDLKKDYKVAMTSYRGTGGGEHLTEGVGIPAEMISNRILSIKEHDMKYYIEQWIRNNSPIIPDHSINWTVKPEKWYKVAIERERKLFTSN